ncbi:hypothetical protein [Pedobacter polaris]|uniref:hypothetical protein n=1 Tax=Pedobacter polaris TaxID=2571273 RepID=UPI00145D93D4|nr:hypothetical protein [Pedobacter polaris]
MNSSDSAKKDEANAAHQTPEAPKSAHATPVVEKYIKKRNVKAEQQIQHEENGNGQSE